MACPLRSAFQTFVRVQQGAGVLPSLPRRLCSSAAPQQEQVTDVSPDSITVMPGVERGALTTPDGEQFTSKIQSLVGNLEIPVEHSTKLRRALTDRSFNEAIFLARRKEGNRVEVLETDLHNERLAVLGNSVINFVLMEKLLAMPDLDLNMHGIQELCYILMHAETLQSLLPNINLDAYIRTKEPNLSNVSRTAAVQAVIGCLHDTKGRTASMEYVRDEVVDLDREYCHRVLKLNHPKLCLFTILQNQDMPPPMIRVVDGQSDSLRAHIVSGDRVLAEVSGSALLSDAQQEHNACQKALLEHFPAELTTVPVPHCKDPDTEYQMPFREESDLVLAQEGDDPNFSEPGWETKE